MYYMLEKAKRVIRRVTKRLLLFFVCTLIEKTRTDLYLNVLLLEFNPACLHKTFTSVSLNCAKISIWFSRHGNAALDKRSRGMTSDLNANGKIHAPYRESFGDSIRRAWSYCCQRVAIEIVLCLVIVANEKGVVILFHNIVVVCGNFLSFS